MPFGLKKSNLFNNCLGLAQFILTFDQLNGTLDGGLPPDVL